MSSPPTFTIVSKKALVSNKPHPPTPTPPANQFPLQKVLQDGRRVWISVPQPDRLSFTVPISSEIYGHGVPEDLPAGAFANELQVHFASESFNTLCLKQGPICSPPQQPGASKTWKWIILAMGSRDASVHISLAGSSAKGLSLRVECNPRKLGKGGFSQLRKVLGGPFNFHGMIAAARVSRLDICVDVVGVRVNELILWYKEEGKRSLYVGSDGALETVQLHKKLPPPNPDVGQNSPTPKTPNNPTGRVQLKAYDRVRERLAAQKDPPFGPAPIARVERPIYRFVQRPLASLPALDNRLRAFRVGFVRSQLPQFSAVWLQYVAARRTMSAEDACALLGVQSAQAKQFRAAEQVPQPDLIYSSEVWEYWKAGLAQTGLLDFINPGGEKKY